MTSIKPVHVAVAAITQLVEGDRRILITKRPASVHQGGLWEFPGGKVEANETVKQALVRELDEELGLIVDESMLEPLIVINHDYGDKKVSLDVWEVPYQAELQTSTFVEESLKAESANGLGKEGQPMRWVSARDLSNLAFPAANRPIIDAICLPSRYVITPEFDSLNAAENYLQGIEKSGFTLVQFRQRQLKTSEYLQWAATLYDTFPDLMFVWNAGYELFDDLPSRAVHLNSAAARQLYELNVSPDLKFFGMSCHDRYELEIAAHLGVNYALLSPVKETKSHPEATPLGITAFADLVAQAGFPVYALGGVGEADLDVVRAAGAQGVAAITAWQKVISSN